jgi:polar amino acid transport system substrate-binding protein
MKKSLLLLILLFTTSLFSKVELTPEEKNFIKTTTVNCGTTSTWAPFNIKDENDNLYGLGIDYINLIKKHSGLNIQCKEYPKWSDVVFALRTKQIDLIPATSISDDKENYGKFTVPYLSYPIAIATTIDKVFISSTAYLENKRVAVGKGYSTKSILLKKYPKINFIETENIDEALTMLSKNEVDAVVDILPVLSYNITKLGMANLKIIGTTQLKFDMRIMIRDDVKYSPLLSILNKALADITLEEKTQLSNKWVSVKFPKKIDYLLILKVVIPLLLLLAYFIYYNRKLNKEIKLRKEIQKKLEHQINIDPLTNLYNRRFLNKESPLLISSCKRYNDTFSLVAIDIDYFKNINDKYGHDIGDKVLKVLASKLLELTRPSDIILRIGGEEFVVILPKTDIDGAYVVARKILKGVQDINVAVDQDVNCNITVSIGVSTFHLQEDKVIEDTLKRADTALYEAKNSGRNKIVLNK